MVPCGGAALVIVAGRGRVAGALFANRLAVGIGLISYSLYLVHWPLFVLVRYGRTSESTSLEKATLIASAIGLATAMYFLVEQPFRRRRSGRRQLSDPAFGLACTGLACALILPSVSAIADRGWPGRVPSDLRAAAAGLAGMKDHHFDAANAQDRVPFPALGQRNAVIVGDSHGADLLTALLRARSQVNFRFLHIFWDCQPILGPRPYGEGTLIRSREYAEECARQAEVLRDNPLLEAADLIVIASSWIDYGMAGLPSTIDYLNSRYRARIVIVGGRFAFTELSALLIQAATVDEANERFDAAKDKFGMKQEIARLSDDRRAAEGGLHRPASARLRAPAEGLVLPALPRRRRAPLLGLQPLDRSRRPARRREPARRRRVRLPVLNGCRSVHSSLSRPLLRSCSMVRITHARRYRDRFPFTGLFSFGLLLTAPLAAQQTVGGCQVLPVSNIWNTPVASLPVAANSSAIVNHIGATDTMHPDFGTVWEGAPIGIPYVVVPNGQAMLPIDFASLDGWPEESDAGPYPIPPTPPIEGGDDPLNQGDRHILVVRQGACLLYELYHSWKEGDWNGDFTCVGARVRRPAGAACRARSSTSPRTPCGRTAGPRPTPPACRSSPAWCATTRSKPARSATPCASRSTSRARATSGQRATRPERPPTSMPRRWACACA